MVPRYPPDPELTGRKHSSPISCGLIEKHNLALEADSLAGALPTGIAQKDLEKLKKGSLPPASLTAAAGCSAAAQAAGSKPEGAGNKEWRLREWLTCQDQRVQHAGLLWLACESRTEDQRSEAAV